MKQIIIEVVQAGRVVFSRKCALTHGKDGSAMVELMRDYSQGEMRVVLLRFDELR